MPDDEPVPSAASRTEFVLVAAVALFRLGGLAGLAEIVVVNIPALERPGGAWEIALVAGLALDSAVLCGVCLRRRRITAPFALADLGVTVIALCTAAWLNAAPYRQPYAVYPYSIISCAAYGVTLRRASSAAAATCLLALANAVPRVLLIHASISSVVFDAGTYVPNAVVAFAAAVLLRRSAAETDQGRILIALYAAEMQRLRHARLLHDRVLQSMESVAAGELIADPGLRAQIAEEALWLRGFVAGETRHAPDLVAQLDELVAEKRRVGLRVTFHCSILRNEPELLEPLTAEERAAVVGAAREALTNVVKHAAVGRAVLRLSAERDRLVLSIVDHGRGFDPAATPPGLGISQSLRGRLAEVGGSVRIDAAVGLGTCVEIALPWRRVGAAPRRPR